MASDGEATQPDEDEMLPDERAVIAERVKDLETLDQDDYRSLEEVAADLGIDLE